MKCFWRFSILRSEGKKNKSTDPNIWFLVCRKIYIWMMKRLFTSKTIYSHIWLNLPKDHRQFFNIFLWIVATKENSLKTRWWRGCNVLKENSNPFQMVMDTKRCWLSIHQIWNLKMPCHLVISIAPSNLEPIHSCIHTKS